MNRLKNSILKLVIEDHQKTKSSSLQNRLMNYEKQCSGPFSGLFLQLRNFAQTNRTPPSSPKE
jgi:hypothetical protein